MGESTDPRVSSEGVDSWEDEATEGPDWEDVLSGVSPQARRLGVSDLQQWIDLSA
jgi:hypothetical protein